MASKVIYSDTKSMIMSSKAALYTSGQCNNVMEHLCRRISSLLLYYSEVQAFIALFTFPFRMAYLAYLVCLV